MRQLVDFIVDTIKRNNEQSRGIKQGIVKVEPYIFKDEVDELNIIHVIDWLEYNGYKNIVQLYKNDGYAMLGYYVGIVTYEGSKESAIFNEGKLVASPSTLDVSYYNLDKLTYTLLLSLRGKITENNLWNNVLDLEDERERIKEIILTEGFTRFNLEVYEPGVSIKDAVLVHYTDDSVSVCTDTLLVIKDDESVIESVINTIATNRGIAPLTATKDSNDYDKLVADYLGSRGDGKYYVRVGKKTIYRVYEMH